MAVANAVAVYLFLSTIFIVDCVVVSASGNFGITNFRMLVSALGVLNTFELFSWTSSSRISCVSSDSELLLVLSPSRLGVYSGVRGRSGDFGAFTLAQIRCCSTIICCINDITFSVSCVCCGGAITVPIFGCWTGCCGGCCCCVTGQLFCCVGPCCGCCCIGCCCGVAGPLFGCISCCCRCSAMSAVFVPAVAAVAALVVVLAVSDRYYRRVDDSSLGLARRFCRSCFGRNRLGHIHFDHSRFDCSYICGHFVDNSRRAVCGPRYSLKCY